MRAVDPYFTSTTTNDTNHLPSASVLTPFPHDSDDFLLKEVGRLWRHGQTGLVWESGQELRRGGRTLQLTDRAGVHSYQQQRSTAEGERSTPSTYSEPN